ncbi:MAG: dihydroorotase [Deltaproteobacteria bacterium]|nr:dihydroorotase [Deltaproteobacteria bacterium]
MNDNDCADEFVIIRGGRVLDPASNTDAVCDIRIENGVIAAIGSVQQNLGGENYIREIDASNKWVVPGLIDMHVHLREPGEEYKEDIATGSLAAAAGGFTTIAAMPNTHPVADNAEVVSYVARRGSEVGLVRVLPVGAISIGLNGEIMAPVGELKRAGAVALSDDGKSVGNARLMRHALEYSQDFDMPVLSHAEEHNLSKDGHMNEGPTATRLGLRGIPAIAEEIAINRDIMLAEYTGGRLHICHVSTEKSVEMVRLAKKRGVKITAEATPHHFTLNEESVINYKTNAKMNPPLRSEKDRLALIAGMADGTIDVIATDHAPHSIIEKDTTFADAAFGVIGLQTALPLSLNLWRNGSLPLLKIFELLTFGPARVLGIPYGRLTQGSTADITIIDPDVSWNLSINDILSKSKNSPFIGHCLQGRIEVTMLQGRIRFKRKGD